MPQYLSKLYPAQPFGAPGGPARPSTRLVSDPPYDDDAGHAITTRVLHPLLRTCVTIPLQSSENATILSDRIPRADAAEACPRSSIATFVTIVPDAPLKQK